MEAISLSCSVNAGDGQYVWGLECDSTYTINQKVLLTWILAYFSKTKNMKLALIVVVWIAE